MNSARTVFICLTGMVIMAFTVYSPVYSVQDSKGIKSQNVDLVLIISMEHRSLNIVRDSLFDILSIICFEKKMCLDRKQNVKKVSSLLHIARCMQIFFNSISKIHILNL